MKSRDNMDILPNTTKDMCFTKEEFTKADFTVDGFIALCRRRGVAMETLRDDLDVYLRVLRSAMIELIHQDYADFVNLSTNLVGLDKAISKITTPLTHTHDEVQGTRTILNDTIISIENRLAEAQHLQMQKMNLKRLADINETVGKLEKIVFPDDGDYGVSTENLNRVVLLYTQARVTIARCDDTDCFKIASLKQKLSTIDQYLMDNLKDYFKAGVLDSDAKLLRTCLNAFCNMEMTDKAENLFKTMVVKPELNTVFSNAERTEERLKSVYGGVIDFVRKHNVLIDLTREQEVTNLSGYSFFLHSIWPVISENMEVKLSWIFAHDNADKFFKRYLITEQFMADLKSVIKVKADVEQLGKLESYRVLQDKWNLPVYYQIRFQEIAGNFESCLQFNNGMDPSHQSDSAFQLTATYVLWRCLHDCWSDSIFLAPLAHRFWKLTLQLLARYNTWMVATVEKDKMADLGKLVSVYNDAEMSHNSISDFYESSILPRMISSLRLDDTDFLKASLKESQDGIRSALDLVGNRVVNQLLDQCNATIKQVTDIPRLYRKTNKEVPSKPCAYAENIMQPVVAFSNEFESRMSAERKADWIRRIVEDTAYNYYTLISDVLTSVRKMEDSLMRLKKSRDKSINQSNTGGASGDVMTDDDKIRRQLALDVTYFANQVNDLYAGVSIPQVETLVDLIKPYCSS